LVVVSVTVYVPAVVNVCTGFGSVDVPPSPNDHTHDAGEFVDMSTNCTLRGTVPLVVFETNDATGADAALPAVIYPLFVSVSVPAAFVAARITVYVPAVV
jgi:hypothetical protein